MKIRKAHPSDLVSIKELADRNRYELGFVLRSALERSIARGEVLVAIADAKIIGFVEYHHRRDPQTTLYHIAVDVTYRGKGVGRELLAALSEDAERMNKTHIALKCPIDLDANQFYVACGFTNTGEQDGRQRRLIEWRLSLD